MTDRPNLVFIMPDQERMDALGCYGNRFVQSPAADRMAAGGARFTHAFTPWPVCTPARASMWTGVYPHAHGLTGNVYGVDDALAECSKVKSNLFAQLVDGGYRTGHFGKWHLGERQPAYFHVWETSFNSRRGHWIDGVPDGRYRPDWQTDASIEFITEQARAGQPFALVQGYYPPHDPYTAPARFYEPYRDRGVPFPGYYAAVSAIDHNLGRMLDALEATGVHENTVVFFFSDHGDTFFYRQEGEHKFVCFDDAIRIPFLVSAPGRIAPGTVLEQPVGLQDLMPTALDFAGLPVPDGLHGRSLRPLLEGGVRDWRRDFYVQNVTFRSQIEQRCIRGERWKLVASHTGAHELYDLSADAEEEIDLFVTPRADPGFQRFEHYPDHAPRIAELALRMRAVAVELDDTRGVELADRVSADIAGRLHG